jgi:hypothetical protein
LGLTIQSKWTHRLMKGWGFQGHRGLGFAILMEILYKAHERGKPINRPHIHQKWMVYLQNCGFIVGFTTLQGRL